MKILYIGPYKNVSLNGISSRYLIHNLRDISNIQLSLHNIVVDSQINNGISYPGEQIGEDIDSYDAVIQHAPVEFVVNNSKIQKSIIFPIIEHLNEKTINLLKIKKFDKLLVDNKYHLDKLKKIFGAKVVYVRYKDIAQAVNQKYNIKFLNKTQKFYFIGSYSRQPNTIKKILLSFMMAFRTNPAVSLTLILEDKSSDLDMVNKEIMEYKKQLNIVNDFRKITIALFDNTEESLMVTHYSGDIFISPIVSKSNIHCDIAQFYKNKILYMDRVDAALIPSTYEYSTGDTIVSPLTLPLVSEMQKISSDSGKNQYFLCDSKYIQDILTKLC
jgi:hypothetical protein